ncbi:hypothetical protein INT47_011404 [Mucor saturninus]|uniref:Uncharacterized protein n=1 Tax=Mucor saturninus TaxID=64648 RepID=A0A8H7QHZ1_9FUNG|nr:hypothetical protein INT47_011404 [Mucor saturninus]
MPFFTNKGSDRSLPGSASAEAVYVMGNWSVPNTRFHEPIRGLGFQQVSTAQPVSVEFLKRFGWLITRALIVEEAMTNYTNKIVPRLCNRDMAVCLNMVDIVR